MTAPMKEHTCLIFIVACMAVMALIFLDHGLRPVGVSQYPYQSVSFTAHSHLERFIVKQVFSKHV